jgi:hypothetical protein
VGVVLGLEFKTRLETVKKVIENVVDIAPVRWPPITSQLFVYFPVRAVARALQFGAVSVDILFCLGCRTVTRMGFVMSHGPSAPPTFQR